MKERFSVTNDRAFKQTNEAIEATISLKQVEGTLGKFHVSRSGSIVFESGNGMDVNKAVKFISAFDKGFAKTRGEVMKRRAAATERLMGAVSEYCEEFGLVRPGFTYKADEKEYIEMSIDLLDHGYEVTAVSSLVFMEADFSDVAKIARYHAFDVLKSLVEFGKTDHRRYDTIMNKELAENLNELYQGLEASYEKLTQEEIDEINGAYEEACNHVREVMRELGTLSVIRC